MRLTLPYVVLILVAGTLYFHSDSITALAQKSAKKAASNIVWVKQRDGLHLAQVFKESSANSFKTEIILLKVDLDRFKIGVADSRQHDKARDSVKSLVKKSGAFAGINANFYGTDSKPLGLVIQSAKALNPLQKGGSVLTGVFYIKDGKANIVHRDNFKVAGVDLAVQSGPRVISKGKLLSFKKSNGATRRSGVAVTKNNEIILFATRNRFPGARLEDIQKILSDPSIAVTDVLNLDGGGSSQFFIDKSFLKDSSADIKMSGGDSVPITLTVSPR